MKKTLLVALLFVLFMGLQAQAQQQILPPLVNVTGVGEVRVQPDQVLLTTGVEVREATLEKARRQVDARSSAVIAYLKKQGVDPKDIQTSFMTVQPIYEGNSFGKTTPDFYVAQKTMTVLIKNLDKFDNLTIGLYNTGINRIDGISFQVSDVEKYKAEARKKAVLQAKQKAETLTSQLGSRLGRVYSIQEISNDGSPRPYQMKMMAESDAMGNSDGPSLAGGTLTISSRVDVSFVLD